MEEEKKSNELKDVTKEILEWEANKLFRNLNHLTTRPGKMITEYCRDAKSKYLSPVFYFFGVKALDYYFKSISGFLDFISKSSLELLRKTFSDPIFAKLGVNTSTIVDEMNSVFSFLVNETGQKIIEIPIFLLTTWLLYKKYNPSFKENSWFALYTYAHVILLTIPLILYWYVTKDMFLNTWISFIILLGYWIWASKQFYHLTKSKAILLGVLMFATVMLAMAFVQVIIFFIVLFIS